MKLNRGQILATAVEASGINKEKVARRAGFSRSAYYKHVANPNLSYHILIEYGKAIQHDFTEEFPDMPKYVLEDPESKYGNPLTIEQAIKQRDQWKDKFYDLLEKYNTLMEEKLNHFLK